MRTIGKICDRDKKKVITYEQQIPLGHTVQCTFVTQEEDFLFCGKKIIKYGDKSIHLHLELACNTEDEYKIVDEDVDFVEASDQCMERMFHQQ